MIDLNSYAQPSGEALEETISDIILAYLGAKRIAELEPEFAKVWNRAEAKAMSQYELLLNGELAARRK
jgi:hypothetical protein